MASNQLTKRIDLLLQLTQGITIHELQAMQPFALAAAWRDSLRLVHRVDELRSAIELALIKLEQNQPANAADQLRTALEMPEVNADDVVAAVQQPADVVTVVLSEVARMAVEDIGRAGESADATIGRILEAISGIAPDFDEFFGEPSDGRGPSGH